MRNFYNEIRGLKVKELPAHVKPMFTIDYIKKSINKGLDNYHAKYIQTSSIDPLLHVCYGGIIFSYLVALPEERRHLEHQQHAKEHGGSGHWSDLVWVQVRGIFEIWGICLGYDVCLCDLKRLLMGRDRFSSFFFFSWFGWWVLGFSLFWRKRNSRKEICSFLS